MSEITRTFRELPDWTFDVDEVSASVYRVRGVDKAGRNVEAIGTDPDELLVDCRRSAAKMQVAGGRPEKSET